MSESEVKEEEIVENEVAEVSLYATRSTRINTQFSICIFCLVSAPFRL